MRTRLMVRSSVVALAASGALTLAAAAPAGASGRDTVYQRHDLVSDVKGAATIQDQTLVNAWGMSQGPATPVWVSDNGTDVTTLYTGDGVVGPITKVPLTVTIPGHGPTGQVFNPTTGFVVDDGNGHSGSALFIFASESGDITGWSPAVPPPAPSTQAQVGKHVDGAIYKGLAMAMVNGSPRLYAANFHAGTIDVFDGSFQPITSPGAFHDPNLPEALRAVQRRRAERQALRRPTRCRTPTPRMRSPVRARGSSTCSTTPGTSSVASSPTAR